MKSKSIAGLVCAALSSLFTSVSLAQISLPTIQASGNHRFIEHAGREKTLQGQLLVVRAETRRLLGGIGNTPTMSVDDNDWAFDVGSNGAASGWPSTYTTGASPDCVNDYVSFTIQAQGTSTQANLVILNNLYVNNAGTGLCAGNEPSVVAAYDVGTSASGNYLGMPWPSADGSKILVIEKGLTGTSTPARLHLITIGAGGGSVSVPIAPPTETVLSFTAGGGNCASGLSGSPSLKDIVVWYASDDVYAADDNGRLYKVTNAFSAPTTAYCISTGSAAVTDVNVDENVIGQPSGTNYVNLVTLGKTLKSYSANSDATAFTSRWSTVVSSVDNGVSDYIVEDGDLKFIYVMTNHESSGSSAQLQQYDYAGSLIGSVTLGPASTQNLNMGTFDHHYLNNINAAATLYYCAYPFGATGLPNLSDVQFDSSWHLNSTPTMTGDSNILPSLAVNGSTCGSMLGSYFEDTSTSPNPSIDIIVGVGNASASAPNRISRWRIQTALADLSPLTSNTSTYQQQVGNDVGGISSYTGDWSSSVLGSNTYNFYFGTLAPQLAGRAPCAIGDYCFVKLQVVSLN